MLVTIVVLGILAAVVVLSVRGITGTAQRRGCEQQYRELATVVSVYAQQTGALPDSEQDLLDAQLANRLSDWYDVGPGGDIDPEPGPDPVCSYDPDG
jgi:general secretion pathway protein G